TGTGLPLGTYDDVDYAAINSTNEIVPGASIGYSTTYGSSGDFIYAANPNGNPPTEAGGSVTLFYDFTNTTSVGIRISTTTYVLGMRFNNEQTNTTYTYDGLPAWEIIFKSGNTFDANSILVTTNDGDSPVVFTSGGYVRLSISANEMEVFQNNPAAPLVFQSPITERSSGTDLAKYGPGLMDLQAACSYNAGTFIYGGTVKIDGAGGVGVGPVSVFSGGSFEAQSGAGNAAPITVASGGTNTVFIAAANGQFNNGTNLTFNSGTTCLQFVYSNSITPSATSAALEMTAAGGVLTLNGTVNVNVMGGNFTTGQFPLIKYGSLAGAGFAALNLNALPPEVQGYLSNNTANSSIDLVITSVGQPLTWDAGSDAWDIGQTADWLDALGNVTNYQQVLSSGESVIFNDSAPGPSITVTLDTNVIPTSVSVDNSVNDYTISGTGGIGGSAALTKTGTGTLTLGTANSFSGGVNLDGGTVAFSALANFGTGPITFNGSDLQYSGNSDDISTRTVTFEAGGATIDVGSQNVTYAKPIGNGGPGGLTKLGSGTLTLNGDLTYSGDTVVAQGILLLNTNSIIPDSPIITVDSGAVLDTATSGVNLALNVGQTLEGIGQVNGIVTVGASSTVEPAVAGVTGTLTIDGGLNIEDQSTVNMVVAPTSNDVIAVTGNLDIETGSSLNLNIIGGTLPIGRYVIMTYSGTLTGSPAGMAIYSNNSGTT
ncbi:MAG: beta strand repeat-containing protein, partial [Limisphaerales bacterium]